LVSEDSVNYTLPTNTAFNIFFSNIEIIDLQNNVCLLIIQGFVFTTDLDFQLHMNNARYLREADFARVKLWAENGIGKAVYRRRGASITNAGNSIRYRRSLQFLNRYKIVTKVTELLIYALEIKFTIQK